MRPTPWIAASVAAIALAGCGGQHARRAESTSETPASYDAIAADRTRGRDDAEITPGGGDVQAAYDRQRQAERASGRIGTAGETARAGQPTNGATGGSSAGSATGGSSAGSEATRGGTEGSPGITTGDAAGDNRPIPYGGSRVIDPRPYPSVPTGGTYARPATAAPRPVPAPPEDGADTRTFGIPAHPGAMRAMPQSNAGATIQGPEGPATGSTTPPPPPSGVSNPPRSGY